MLRGSEVWLSTHSNAIQVGASYVVARKLILANDNTSLGLNPALLHSGEPSRQHLLQNEPYLVLADVGGFLKDIGALLFDPERLGNHPLGRHGAMPPTVHLKRRVTRC
eukprot:2923306-Pyramimonas_sp.AAC.2